MENDKKLGAAIRTLSILMKRRMELSSAKHTADSMTGMHGWIIGYLSHNSERVIFQRDLQEFFSMRRSTASNVLQLMEKNGLIRRLPVENDARLKKIVLTDRAEKLHRDIEKEIGETEALMKQNITDEEVEAFLNISGKIIANLEAAAKKPK